jgi:hypothetical protein
MLVMNNKLIRQVMHVLALEVLMAGLSLFGLYTVIPPWLENKSHETNVRTSSEQRVTYYQHPDHSTQLKNLIIQRQILGNSVRNMAESAVYILMGYLILGMMMIGTTLWLWRLIRLAWECHASDGGKADGLR